MSYRKSPDRFLGKSHTSDDGFTLVELLVVTVIIPLVVGAIAVGLVAVFSLQSRTNQRLSYSGDLQMANATFVKDVQSAEYVTLSQSSARQCGTTGVQLLGLHWSGGLTAVTYALVPVDNGTTGVSLERFYCTLGTSTTPASSLIVAPDFAPSTLISDAQHTYLLPTVCVNGISSTDCVSTQTSYPNVSNIAAVQLPVYEPMSAAGYYTMTATPRSAFSTPGGNPNPLQLTPPFTLLFNNGGTTCTGSSTVLYVGNGSLTVNTNSGLGQLGVASPCANSVNYTNQAAINASTILTANPGGTSILSNQPKTPPPSTSFFSGFSDPLASTMSKFSPSSPPTTKGSCTLDKKKSIMQCTAGYYDISNSPISNTGGAPTISNGDTVCFTGQDASGADTTWFATDFNLGQGTGIGNNVSLYFNYTCGTSKSPAPQPGSSEFIFAAKDSTAFATSSSTNNGVWGSDALLYAPTGTMTFGPNSYVQLSTTSTNNYCDVTVWDGGQYDPSTLSGLGVVYMGPNSNSTPQSYGGIYIPQGALIDKNGGTITAAFIIVGSAQFDNGLTVNINEPTVWPTSC